MNKSNIELRYNQMMEAARIAPPGRLLSTAATMMGVAEQSVMRMKSKMKQAGFDMTLWEEKAKLSNTTLAEHRKVVQQIVETNEQRDRRRAACVRDMKLVTGTQDANEVLARMWGLTLNGVFDVMQDLREAGIDLAFWRASAPTPVAPTPVSGGYSKALVSFASVVELAELGLPGILRNGAIPLAERACEVVGVRKTYNPLNASLEYIVMTEEQANAVLRLLKPEKRPKLPEGQLSMVR